MQAEEFWKCPQRAYLNMFNRFLSARSARIPFYLFGRGLCDGKGLEPKYGLRHCVKGKYCQNPEQNKHKLLLTLSI